MLREVETKHLTRPNANGHASAAEVLEDALGLSSPTTLWQRLFKWEKGLIVAGRTIEKGWVVPQPLGIALLVVMLGGVGSLYWRLTDKVAAGDAARTQESQQLREMMIRMDQKLTDKDIHDRERNEEIQKRFQNADAVDIVMNRDIQTLKVKVGVK